jgi:hypothetical protein
MDDPHHRNLMTQQRIGSRMPLIAATVVGVVGAAPSLVSAQQPRRELAIAVDAGSLPDRLASSCRGNGSSIRGIGGQLAGRMRPGRRIVVQLDTRLVLRAFGESGCERAEREARGRTDGVIPQPSIRDVITSPPAPPFTESLAHVGVEGSVGAVQLRGSAGVGIALFGKHGSQNSIARAPIGALSLAARVGAAEVEVERLTGEFVPLYGDPGKVRPTWFTVRFGWVLYGP